MRFSIKCPHCDSRSITRNSREMSLTLRELTFSCTEPECGHTYVAILEVVRTLSESANPREGLNIPFSPAARPKLPPSRSKPSRNRAEA